MIEFEPLPPETLRAPEIEIPTELGYYLGQDSRNNRGVLVELKVDGKFHAGHGTIPEEDVPGFAPYQKLVPEGSAGAVELSMAQKYEVTHTMLSMLNRKLVPSKANSSLQTELDVLIGAFETASRL